MIVSLKPNLPGVIVSSMSGISWSFALKFQEFDSIYMTTINKLYVFIFHKVSDAVKKWCSRR
jgi:hypothetical protein